MSASNSKIMFLKQFFIPKDFINSIYEIDKSWLEKRQLKGLIVDLDNTLLGRADTTPDEQLKKWVKGLISENIKIVIVSNNWSARVKNIAANLELEVIAPAAKPMSWAFKQAIKKLNTHPSKIAVVGDQLFTDILGGNFLKLYTVMVPPVSEVDLIHTKILRVAEKLILRIGAKRSLSNGKWIR